MTLRIRIGRPYRLARVACWVRARLGADGTFGEDGTGDFPPRDAMFAHVVGDEREGHAPCIIGSAVYWVPLDDLREVRVKPTRKPIGSVAVAAFR